MGPKKHEAQDATHDDEIVEEADLESFPASDPPSWTLGIDPEGPPSANETESPGISS